MSPNPVSPKSQVVDDLNIELVRADFPIFERKIHDRPICYLDNANTSQRPRKMIDATVN